MDQIIKNQPDWDKTINNNFAKFVKDKASSDVIYLNGASKSAKNGYPLWWRCNHLGIVDVYLIGGYIDLPTVPAGRKIDIFNIPGAGQVEFVQAQLFDDFLADTLYLTKSDNKTGTIAIHNSAKTDASAHTSGYQIIMMCPNNL